MGVVRRLRPRRAVPAVGRDAGAAAADPAVHPRTAPALGRRSASRRCRPSPPARTTRWSTPATTWPAGTPWRPRADEPTDGIERTRSPVASVDDPLELYLDADRGDASPPSSGCSPSAICARAGSTSCAVPARWRWPRWSAPRGRRPRRPGRPLARAPDWRLPGRRRGDADAGRRSCRRAAPMEPHACRIGWPRRISRPGPGSVLAVRRRLLAADWSCLRREPGERPAQGARVLIHEVSVGVTGV